jgi:hypothetical protein
MNSTPPQADNEAGVLRILDAVASLVNPQKVNFMRCLMILCLGMLLGGCTSVQQAFPGHDSATVWTALVAVAQSPDYDDMEKNQMWEVRDNGVWPDAEGNRIEIYRRLHRTFYESAGRYHEETRQYLIVVTFNPGSTPSATFKVKKGALPAWSRNAGVRYFADVMGLLEDAGPGASKSEDGLQPGNSGVQVNSQPDDEAPDLEDLIDSDGDA